MCQEHQQRIDELLRENDVLRAALDATQRLVAQLQARVDELECQLARPAAPFRRPEAKKVPETEKKKPGRKPGHPGARRQRPQRIDYELNVPLDACPKCGGPVSDRLPLEQIIEEIPPIQPVVFRLTTYGGKCACCGDVRSTHPLQTTLAQGAAAVHLGPRALALAALLNKQLGNTMGKTCQILRELCGLSISRGGLSQALDRIADKVESDYQQLIETIRNRPAVFADETSWWVGGPGWWLWTFTTPQETLYRVDQCRGSEVVLETLGEDFPGMLVSDCLASYDPPPYRKHKCTAHHLQAIEKARASPGCEDSAYLRQWKLFFAGLNVVWNSRGEMSEEEFAKRREALHAWADRLLNEPCEHPAEVKVRNRLAKQREHLLGCLDEPAAEPTNNRAERALRPAVIARKVSCGNKTNHGRRTWERLVSLAQTCKQRGESFIDYLTPRLALDVQAG